MELIFITNEGKESMVIIPTTPSEKKRLSILPEGKYEIQVISEQTMLLDKSVTDCILIKPIEDESKISQEK
jgi:hypothetical protein